jgi:hypothetical protein
MKHAHRTETKPGWFHVAGWAIAILLLIALGIVETMHKEDFRRQQADWAKQKDEWVRKEAAYYVAGRFVSLYTNAPAALNMAQVLRDIGAVNTAIMVPETFKSRINADDLKTKLDAELRKGGVALDAKSNFEVSLVVDGTWYDTDGLVMPLLSLNLNESVPVRRADAFSLISVASYRASRFSIVKATQVQDVMGKMVESLVEAFTKDYAAVNKK